MKLEFFEPDDLSSDIVEKLWNQSVDLDDWDYLLITTDLDSFEEVEDEDGRITWSPTSSTIERLLTGCCSNIWYKISWRGKKAMVGVAYHS